MPAANLLSHSLVSEQRLLEQTDKPQKISLFVLLVFLQCFSDYEHKLPTVDHMQMQNIHVHVSVQLAVSLLQKTWGKAKCLVSQSLLASVLSGQLCMSSS